jgi:hypothetical protein
MHALDIETKYLCARIEIIWGFYLPRDPDFQKKREKIGKDESIAIWGPVEPPEKLGARAGIRCLYFFDSLAREYACARVPKIVICL